MERKMIVKLPTLEEQFSGRDAEYVNRRRLARSPTAIAEPAPSWASLASIRIVGVSLVSMIVTTADPITVASSLISSTKNVSSGSLTLSPSSMSSPRMSMGNEKVRSFKSFGPNVTLPGVAASGRSSFGWSATRRVIGRRRSGIFPWRCDASVSWSPTRCG